MKLGTLGGSQTMIYGEGMVLTRWHPLRRNERGVMVGTIGSGAGILWRRFGVGDAGTGGAGP